MSTFATVAPSLPLISFEADVTNSPTSGTRTWTDLTPRLRALTYRRSGRNDELQRTEPGQLSATLSDRGGTVTNLGLGAAHWVRVQASYGGTVYPRWQGIVESLGREWPSAGKDATIALTAVDTFKVLNFYDLSGATFAAQTNGTRVAAIAALASVTTATIDVNTDSADAVGTAFAENSWALSELQTIEGSENGLLYIEPDGRLSFQGRHWRLLNAGTPVVTFGEIAGQIPYRDSVSYTADDQWIANLVEVTTSTGTVESATNSTSQARYFGRKLTRTLTSSSALLAQDAANYLVGRYAAPSARIPQLDISFRALATQGTALGKTLLSLGNSSRVRWSRNFSPGTITADAYVEQIAETVTPGNEWAFQIQLSPAGDESGWVLGDTVLGVLDSTTRLTY